ncbi:MAG: hypothetical protein KatS3mg094_330 [Candidatus Parcubacteria bacterium]|nr:MAG: hypothetical protein KatS3mg094_330 [Candidatus Parcubacteria bacterium]
MKLIKFLKIRKIYLIAIFLLIFIFSIGLISLISSQKFKSLNNDKNSRDLSYISPDEIDNILNIIDREQKKIERDMTQLVLLANINLNNRQISEEIDLINNLSYLLNKINTDSNKSEREYAIEFVNVLNKVNLNNFDLSNKQSLYNNGIYLLGIADELAEIKPPVNYINIHRAQVFILGGIGYALKELSATEDYEKAFALIRTIDNLIEAQNKLANILK